MSFSRLKGNKPAATPTPAPQAAAPQPAPEVAPPPVAEKAVEVVKPEVKQAEVVKTEAKPAAQAKPAAGGLIIPTVARNALAMIAKEDDAGSFQAMFPTIVLKGGNAGGTMVPSGDTDKEIAKVLPQGKQPIQGVFMAYRSQAIAWPTDFDSKQEGDKPSINCAIPANDPDNTALLLTGSENFQFAPKDVKLSKWLFKAGGPGFIRPVFEMLIYLPQFDDVVVLQSSPLLKTYRTLASQLMQYVNEQDGSLGVFPATFEVTTDQWYEDNVYHYWKITAQMNDAGAAAYAKYQAFIESLKTNRPDMIANIQDWFAGQDRPIKADDLARLKQAANLVNPRRRRG